jgi:hypothetical protein
MELASLALLCVTTVAAIAALYYYKGQRDETRKLRLGEERRHQEENAHRVQPQIRLTELETSGNSVPPLLITTATLRITLREGSIHDLAPDLSAADPTAQPTTRVTFLPDAGKKDGLYPVHLQCKCPEDGLRMTFQLAYTDVLGGKWRWEQGVIVNHDGCAETYGAPRYVELAAAP